jgi:hypothetical protein
MGRPAAFARHIGYTTACALLLAACGGGKSASHHKTHSTRPSPSVPTRSTTTVKGATTTTTTSTAHTTAPPRTTTTEGSNGFLQNLLEDGRNANVKVVYDTPTGRVTVIRRDGDSVYADGTGVRFTLGSHSYDCSGSGDGATCSPVNGDATQSDIDAYTGLVADALSAPSSSVNRTTSSILGRTAECIDIIGRQTARAGRSVQACIDDDTGVLLRFSTLGAPDPGEKLYAVSVAAPSDADFQLPVPPTSGS